jgi:heat shock protein HslJ/uncharacterized protein YecT (DUF1311 family)
MTSSARSPTERFGAAAVVVATATSLFCASAARAQTVEGCEGAPPERSACLQAREAAVADELAAAVRQAVDHYGRLDAITGNQRSSRIFQQSQVAFALYRDLDCHLVELQGGPAAADSHALCRIEHDRQRLATVRARLPDPLAAGDPDSEPADTAAADGESGPAAMSDADIATTLQGPEWWVTEIDGKALAAGVEASFAIDAEGRVSGRGGCNRYFGSAEIAGDRLDIGELGSTRMACPEPAMGEEQRLLAALGGVAGWRIEAGRLQLEAEDGTVLVRLEQAAG